MLPDLSLETVALAAFLAFCRIGACFMLMPGLSRMRVAMHVRLFVAVAVTWALLAHLWDVIVPFVGHSVDALIVLIASELLIGATIGLVTRLYTLALQFAGAAIAMTGGFGGMTGSAVDEMEPQAAVTAIITTSALLLLFALDFHHEVLKALIASYEVAPLGRFFDAQGALIAASPRPGLFPDLYNRRSGAAMGRESHETRQAEIEAGRVATATARTNIVERAWREAFRLEERDAAEKETLENVERTALEPKPGGKADEAK